MISYDKPIVMLEDEPDNSKLIGLLKQCFLIYKTSLGYNRGKNLSGGFKRDYEHEFAKAGYNQSDKFTPVPVAQGENENLTDKDIML